MSRRRVAALLAVAALAGLALAARTLPVRSVVLPASGEVRLLGADAWYHLRHARSALRHFPRLQRFDVGTGYPTGEPAWHAGLFHVGLAAAAKLAPGPAGEASDASSEAGKARLLRVAAPDTAEARLRRVVAHAPAWLGALSVLALYALARASLPRWGAVLAAALYVLHPGRALDRTLLGAADHHAAELLLAPLALAGLHHLLVREPPGLRRPALLASLPLAVFAFTWLGAPLHFVLAGAALAAVMLAVVALGDDAGPTGRAGLHFGAGLGAWLIAVALLAPWLVMQPDAFGPLLLLTAGLGLGPWLGARIVAFLRSRGVGPRAAATTLGSLLLASVATLLAASDRVRFLVGELLARKPFGVSEHQDLGLVALLDHHGVVAVMAPLAVPMVVWAVARRRAPAAQLLPVVFTLGLALLVWRTRDYGYTLPPFLALLAAGVFVKAAMHGRSTRARAALGLALAAALVVPQAMGLVRRPWLDAAFAREAALAHDGWMQATQFLRERTPDPTLDIHAQPPRPASGDLAYPEGTTGVMTAWDLGSLVAALGERPVVVSGGPRREPAAWLLAASEEEALALACPQCQGPEAVRFVALGARTAAQHFLAQAEVAGLSPGAFRAQVGVVRIDGQPVPLLTYGPRHGAAMVARLVLDDGQGLGRHRLVYESPHLSGMRYRGRFVDSGAGREVRIRLDAEPLDTPADVLRFREFMAEPVVIEPEGWLYGARLVASVKIFEVVPGAVLRGRAAPGATVEARLALRARSTGRRLEHRVAGRASPEGRFALRVPYATDALAGDVEPLGPWELRASGSPWLRSVRVMASQVQDGAEVTVPDAAH